VEARRSPPSPHSVDNSPEGGMPADGEIRRIRRLLPGFAAAGNGGTRHKANNRLHDGSS
jgi:hypothetical protein